MNTPKKIVISGVLAALSLVAFMLENLFPPLFIVGGRIGISNFFVLIAGIVAGFWYGFSVLTVKAVLGSILTGNFGAVLYSLPAGTIAYVVEMLIIIYLSNVSIVAASVVGGVINSCMQNVAFCLITATPEYIVYLPYLALIGTLGGIIVGTAVFITLKLIPLKFSNTAL